jgi:putative membrane protein
VIVSKLLQNPGTSDLIIMIIAIILSGIIAAILTIKIAKFTSNKINKFNYSKISIIILGILIALTIIFSHFLGLLIFITATSLGITAIEKGVKRTELMGCLLVPTILFYLI